MSAARALTLLAAVLGSGCGGNAAPDTTHALLVAATEAPTDADNSVEPSRRYPSGSRVVLVDLSTPQSAPLCLTEGFDAAGGATSDHTTARIAFVGRRSPAEAFGVWTCTPQGDDLRRAVQHPSDCGGVALLPDGRIAYAAALPGEVGRRGWALHVAAGDGGPGARITFGSAWDVDPHVLRDGRIAYTTRIRGEAGAWALFTVHPDGTGAAPLNVAPGPRARVVQGPDGTLYLNTDQGVRSLSWSDPTVPGPAVPEPAAKARWLTALPGRALLATSSDGASSSLGLLGGGLSPVRATAGRAFVHAAAVVPFPRPQGHLSVVKSDGSPALLLAVDARPPEHRDAAAVRLRRQEDGDSAEHRTLGEVPLADDGSFFARVPADTPLYLDLLDAAGEVLVEGRTPFWVRPNEVRVCVGCHESPDTAPPNRRPHAVRTGPVDLARAAKEGTR